MVGIAYYIEGEKTPCGKLLKKIEVRDAGETSRICID
jgi:hypothetical protein